jgi:glyoxylase-like metal-dependent hydrolase (beta-lactamase superfamily II)
VQLFSVEGNGQRLDGGAMFGNAPRALWSRWCPPDEQNRIDLACRALLVREDDGRTLLFEAGIGTFFPPDLRERYGVVEPEHVLLRSLAALGVAPDDVDVIVLSHLHFDHAGGVLEAWAEGVPPKLAFPRASFVVGRRAWERANAPHSRDRASFIPELPALLQATGRLELVDGDRSTTLGPRYRLDFSEGHTPGLMLATVDSPRGAVTFMGDLVPGAPWVHLPITMGYDRWPERLIDEKRELLERIRAEDGWVFFTHDAKTAIAKVAVDERGRYHAAEGLPSLAWT